MFTMIQTWLLDNGLAAGWAGLLASAISFTALLAVSLLAFIVARRPGLHLVHRITRRTSSKADDRLMDAGFFRRIALLIPALIVYVLTPAVLPNYPAVVTVIHNALFIAITITAFTIVDALLNGVNAIYSDTPSAREVPIKGFLQGVKIVVFVVCFILVVSALLNRTPFFLLSGLGALTAILMLIFKDAILGFVAGIQLAGNKMVANGDWISMPQYGADGAVIDVALTTVKIQNWDKTVTTVPTYALISESFQNWRGMFEAGGRRIMRSINIDIGSIRLCTPEMLERYAKIEHIHTYLGEKQDEIARYNREHGVNESCRVNGRRLTNVGTFRAYITAYLRNHPDINQDLTFLVRQLQPTEHGLPIQIYVFSKVTAWADYEAIQADIFDHLLAVAPEFDLRIFQAPSGADVQDVLQQVG